MTARATQVLKTACLRPGDWRGPLPSTHDAEDGMLRLLSAEGALGTTFNVAKEIQT